MSQMNNDQAFCLASTYNLMPSHAVYPSRIRNTNPGKFEPDHNELAQTRTMILAHFADASNVLIKFSPFQLEY
jgi:hypothetical protein